MMNVNFGVYLLSFADRTRRDNSLFTQKKIMAKSKTSFSELINSETPVVVDFFATWCGPCKAYSPILQELKRQEGDAIRLVKIDVDKNQVLSQKLGIRAMPTTVIFQEGEEKFRASGVQSIGALQAELNKLR